MSMANSRRFTNNRVLPMPLHCSFLFIPQLLGLLFFFFMLITRTSTTEGCLEAEREAVLAFKAGIIRDPSNRLSSWHGRDCCRWRGVVCDNTSSSSTGHVVELNLQNPEYYDFDEKMALRGEFLSQSLLSLTHLDRLDLSWNDFGGIQIPEFVGSFNKLRYLDLTGSNFSRVIPPQLGNLSSLQYLSLSENYDSTTDNLEWLSRLSSVRHLDMSYVNLSKASHNWLQTVNMLPSLRELDLSGCDLDSHPSSLSYANLTALTTLDLSVNYLNSTIPDWLWELNSLSYLDLSHNLLSGPLPPGIGNLTSLTKLDLSSNLLSGPLPPGIGNLTSLTKLDLSYNLLSGPLSPGIGNLTSLTKLDLFQNSLSGPLPPGIGNLTSLTWLFLSSNLLTGPIPAEIGNITSLRDLDLHDNSLSGPVPAEMGKLLNLQYLDLSSNSLQGSLSELHFASLTKLHKLHLSENFFLSIALDHNWVPPFQLEIIYLGSCKVGPRFPRWLRSQKSIRTLDLSNTSIEDTLPAWFWNSFPNISNIDLSHNQISGTLPTSLESITHLYVVNLGSNRFEGSVPTFPTNLWVLDLSRNSLWGPLPPTLFTPNLYLLILSYNHINGSLPSYICNLKQLGALDLSNNQISGEIPHCWQEATHLFFVHLGNNNLSGQIPSSLGNLLSIKSLHLNNNMLRGHLPPSLQNCSNLVVLDLGDNKFSGNIPVWIEQSFQQLEVLRLRSNMFSGDIPSQLGQLDNLQIIDLANNKLSGPIPHSFGNFSSMISISKSMGLTISLWRLLAQIPIHGGDSITLVTKGHEFRFSSTLYLVKSIDLSNNNLTKEIPSELGALVGLQTLNLSRNNLRGQIPNTIGRMRSLETLDLSLNKLSGSIPQSLSTLTSLSHLNLSYNNLSGIIPSGNQLQTLNDASIYVGNAYLCGAPTTKSCFDDNNIGVIKEEHGEVSQLLSINVGITFGFLVGLWSVFVILLFKKDWRNFYFQMIDKKYDEAYVAVKISVARLMNN